MDIGSLPSIIRLKVTIFVTNPCIFDYPYSLLRTFDC